MIWIFAVVGGLVTGGLVSLFLDDDLFLLGALPGFGIGLLVGLVIKVGQMEWRLRRLEQRLDHLAASPAAPEPKPAAEGGAGRGDSAREGRSPAGPVPAARTGQPAAQAPEEAASPPRAPEPAPAAAPPSPPPPAAPRAPAAVPPGPREPGPVDRLLKRAAAFFTGENAVVRVGLLVLFFGVAFLYKYGLDQDWIGVEWNYISVAVLAFAALGWGWRLRSRRRAFALLLQGGAVGVLYITVFAAFRLHGLLPLGLALGLMLALVGLAAALALLQNARALATAGAAGGFLAPVLVSTGGGSHVVLFGYYALLDAGILAIAWFRAWRELNLVGFLFTLGIGAAWGYSAYRPEHFATTEPFLVLFFLMFSLVGALYALRQPPRLAGYIDATLVFGTPLTAFGLQWLLVREWDYAAAYSALAVAGYYVMLARWAWRRAQGRTALRPLAEAYLALAVAFATLAIPLALEGVWLSVAWVLEGAALVWVGVRQGRRLAAVAGLGLQLVAAVLHLRGAMVPVLGTGGDAGLAGILREATLPLLNSLWLSGALIAAAALASGWWLSRCRERWEWVQPVEWVVLAWGLAWWLKTQAGEVNIRFDPAARPAVLLAATAASFALFRWLGQRGQWRPLELSFLLLLPAMGLALVTQVAAGLEHPFSRLGWAAWPAAVALWYHGLRAGEPEPGWPAGAWLHRLGLWLLLVVSCLELAWQVNDWVGGATLWGRLVWAVLPAAVVWELGVSRRWQGWPVAAHVEDYRRGGLVPVAAWLWLWVLYTGPGWRGTAAPLPYLPLLNPLELTQLAVLAALAAWLLRHREWVTRAVPARLAAAAWAGTLFLWFNGVLARTAHHLMGVPFRFEALMDSFRFQALVSVFWGLTALVLMVAGSRRGSRTLWTVGLGLYGLTVVKLFLMDLAGRGTLERIVSFLVVGVLLVVTGFFARRPAADGEGRT